MNHYMEDNVHEEIDLENATVPELKEYCEQMGLDTSGMTRRNDFVELVRQYQQPETPPEAQNESQSDSQSDAQSDTQSESSKDVSPEYLMTHSHMKIQNRTRERLLVANYTFEPEQIREILVPKRRVPQLKSHIKLRVLEIRG